VAGAQLSVQRTITLTVGAPQTVWYTATPTVVIGVTVTARGSTVVRTLSQTQTLIVVPATVTQNCANPGATRTVTNYAQGPTVTVQSTILRTATDGQVTSQWQTTLTQTASCHYPGSGLPSPVPSASFCIGASCQTFGPGQGWRPDEVVNTALVAAEKREVAATAALAAVAAVTSTYTQTTYTVTSTLQTTIPGRTVTENVLRTVTATMYLHFSAPFSWLPSLISPVPLLPPPSAAKEAEAASPSPSSAETPLWSLKQTSSTGRPISQGPYGLAKPNTQPSPTRPAQRHAGGPAAGLAKTDRAPGRRPCFAGLVKSLSRGRVSRPSPPSSPLHRNAWVLDRRGTVGKWAGDEISSYIFCRSVAYLAYTVAIIVPVILNEEIGAIVGVALKLRE
jgi:hypothetical protein